MATLKYSCCGGAVELRQSCGKAVAKSVAELRPSCGKAPQLCRRFAGTLPQRCCSFGSALLQRCGIRPQLCQQQATARQLQLQLLQPPQLHRRCQQQQQLLQLQLRQQLQQLLLLLLLRAVKLVGLRQLRQLLQLLLLLLLQLAWPAAVTAATAGSQQGHSSYTRPSTAERLCSDSAPGLSGMVYGAGGGGVGSHRAPSFHSSNIARVGRLLCRSVYRGSTPALPQLYRRYAAAFQLLQCGCCS